MNKLKVLYEDNHVIVVYKPSNVLSQSDCTGDLDLLTMVKSYIKEKYNKPGNVYIGLVHRLDRPVSGIMVFARTSKAARRLAESIQKGNFTKEYVAVIHGIPLKEKDHLVDYLEKLSSGNTIVSVKERGKLAILDYCILKRNYEENICFVSIHLETGRHHQIRVQFSSRGYPLCGDQRYGKMDHTQIALCSNKLIFPHPITNEMMSFEIDIPEGEYWDFFRKCK